MAITRIKNNQITDAAAGNIYLGVNAAVKLQDYSITSGKIANDLTYNSSLTITGNLTVQGNTTTIDTTNLTVEDPIIILASEQSGSPSLDIGFIGERGTSENITLVWKEDADTFVAAFTNDLVTNTTVTIASYADFKANNIVANGTFRANGTSTLVGNTSVGNLAIDANKVFIVGAGSTTDFNLINLSNVADPVGAQDVATKNYVDTSLSSIFTLEDDATNTTTVADGDTVQMLGTANEVDVVVGNLSVTFGLPDDVTIGNTLTVTDEVNATGNISGGNLSIGNAITAGTTIVATGNITGANIDAVSGITAGTTIVATGNITGGNIITAGFATVGTTLDVTGNATVGNLGTAGLIIATGNIDGGNINTVGDVIATGNVNGANVNTDSIVGTNITITATSIDMELTGNLSMSGRFINDLGTPSLSTDAATKQYVDDAVSAGIHIHTPVDVETPAALPAATYVNGGNTFTVNQTIAGNTVVFTTAANLQVNDQLWFTNSFNGVVGNLAYFVVSTPNTSAAVLTTVYNGVPVSNITSGSGLTEAVRVNSGVGANLTANTNGALTIDGFSVSAGNRVLVYNQLNQIENGVYDVTNAGNVSAPWILTRSSDADLYIPDSSIGLDQGSYFYVQYGDTGAGESYVKTAPPGPFIFGVANIEFTQFSSSQVYSANTQAGLVLNGTVFSAKVDNDTTAFDGSGNIIVKTGANLVTPNIGNAVGNSLTVTGNIECGNLISDGAVIGNVEILGNLEVANLTVTDLFNGNIVSISNTISATGNITGGNLVSNALVSGANSQVTTLTQNRVVYVGADSYLVDSANFTFDGTNANLQGQLIVDNFTVDGTSITSNANLTITSSSNGNVDVTPNGTGVVNIDNITIADNTIGSSTGNIILDPAGTINLPDEISNAILYTGSANQVSTDANLTYDGTDVQLLNGNIKVGDAVANVFVTNEGIQGTGRLVINQDSSDVDFAVNGDTTANIFYIDAGTETASFGSATQTTGAIVAFNAPNSILIPTGNSAQRPGSPVTGMIRFNTTLDSLEFYDADSWVSAGTVFTVIDSEVFNGDGSTVAFTLDSEQTTDSCIVSINGVLQIPVVAYAVSGNVLTFTEAPLSQDVIEVRKITTTVTVKAIANSTGNAVIEVEDTSSNVLITGDVIPTSNATQNLGSPTNQWNDLFLSGNSIYIGDVILKAGAGNLQVRNFDDTADAGITGTFYTTSTTSGNLQIGFNHIESTNVNGNIELRPNGVGLVTVSTRLQIGNIQVVDAGSNTVVFYRADGTTPATISNQNIDSTQIASGTSSMAVIASGGNIRANVGGATIATFWSGGINNGQANGVGNIGTSSSYFNTVFAKATSAQYADLAEMYEADAEYLPGTVVCFGGTKEVTLCDTDNCRRVAGVVSTNPSYLMNSALEGEHVIAVALTGRVPCRVRGSVAKGDLMVSAGDGTAKANNDAAVGTVIGKALQDFAGTEGTIEVVVGRV
jgi:hypothetical protein